MTGPELRATAPEPDDGAGHYLPDDVWAEVVVEAEARAINLTAHARALEAREAAGAEPDEGGAPFRPAGIDRTITARSHGGAMPGGPRLGVIHSAETPLRAGYAYSIAANWFATKATTSATVMIDPAETVRLLPDDVVAYHVGPKGNGFTVGVEQAGYAHLTAAEWQTPAGLEQMRRVAEYMVDCHRRWGLPLKWASDAEIRAAAAGGPRRGWTTHEGIRRVLGGTTHTDPGANYPAARLMNTAVSIANGTDPSGDDMPLTAADLTAIDKLLTRKLGSKGLVSADGSDRLEAIAGQSRTLHADLAGRIAGVARAVGVADANDTPQTLAASLAPLLAGPIAAAVREAVAGDRPVDPAQLEATVERAVVTALGGDR